MQFNTAAKMALWNDYKRIIRKHDAIKEIAAGLAEWDSIPRSSWGFYFKMFTEKLSPESKATWDALPDTEKGTWINDSYADFSSGKVKIKPKKGAIPKKRRKGENLQPGPDNVDDKPEPADPNSTEGLVGDLQTDEKPAPKFKPSATKTNQAPAAIVGSTTDSDGTKVQQVADLPSDKPGSNVLSSGPSTYDTDAKLISSTNQLIQDGNELLDQIENGTATNPVETRNRLNEIVTNIAEAREELNNTTMSIGFEDDQRINQVKEARNKLSDFERRVSSVDGTDANEAGVDTGMGSTVDAWVDKVQPAAEEKPVTTPMQLSLIHI